jgi:dTDP-4-amino-4,6-dideoxygalactose transaminase
MDIPMVDLVAQHARIRAELEAAVRSVSESGRFIGGEECAAFEREFARFCGVAHACGVANGTDALVLALRAFGVGPGDEVATVANTFIATGAAVLLVGARPVFVDVEERTGTMDPACLEAALAARPKVKLVVPVHLYGHPADMTRIRAAAAARGLPVLEDAAQAHGATWEGRPAGSLGDAACFSFYPAKNLGAMGDGGAVVSSDASFLARVRQLANHGAGTHRYDNVVLGTNSRLDALQAAVLRVKLRRLAEWNDERRARVAAYDEALLGLAEVTRPREHPPARSAWHLYTIRTRDRDALQEHLQARGIASAVHYPRPIHLQPALAAAGGRAGDLPVSERLAREVLSLPLYPELPMDAVRRIADEVRAFCASLARA